MRNLWLFCICLIALSACSNETPAITKVEPTVQRSGQESTNPATEELPNEPEPTSKSLEFQLPNKQITISLDRVPILKQYLSINDQSTAIKQMHIKTIDHPDDKSLYLLQFACSNQLCSYLLLNQTGYGSSYLIADLATVDEWIVSPDGNYIAFKLSRANKDLDIEINKVVLLDIDSMETTPLITNELKNELTKFNWPIEEIIWENHNELTVKIPDITVPTLEHIQDWHQTEEKPTKSVNISIVR